MCIFEEIHFDASPSLRREKKSCLHKSLNDARDSHDIPCNGSVKHLKNNKKSFRTVNLLKE